MLYATFCMWVCLAFSGINLFSVYCELVKNNAGEFYITDEERTVEGETIREVTRFNGIADTSIPEDFKILMVDGEQMLIGARNRVYVISLSGLEQVDVIEWAPSPADVAICKSRKKTEDECQNYIRVIVKKNSNGVFICGTNAFKPWCRTYGREGTGYMSHPLEDLDGRGKCPFDPSHNTTAIFADQRLFTGSIADLVGQDPLIYAKALDSGGLPVLRTEPHSSEVLNNPDFVSSFEFEDQVFFFFRETAVEAINCGKTVFSRVGRVCKNDKGGDYLLNGIWTSFFKSRLNCSMPADYPFYFDEIESTSELGQGNYMPSLTMDNRTDMVYAVFNTPQNSIHGSAVCAFRFQDIVSTFEGPFKHQQTWQSNWLPLSEDETPSPHPAKTCSNGSLNDQTLNFINSHPLMDKAVPAFGGKPVLVQTSFNFRLTVIAVDWQVYAADNKRYDVLFIGTTDGRIVKAINKGGSPDNMDTVVIEDIQVFDNKAPVLNIQVHRNDGRVMVVSKYEIKSILLQRCHLQETCSECVALQDPYCSWHDGLCRFTRKGLQSIDTAKHHRCRDSVSTTKRVMTTPVPTCAPCPVCTKPPATGPKPGAKPDQPAIGSGEDKSTTTVMPVNHIPTRRPDQRLSSTFLTTELRNDIPQMAAEPNTGAMKSADNLKYASHEMALAVVFTMLLTLIIGFILGYIVSERGILPFPSRKHRKNQDEEIKNCDKLDEKNYNVPKKVANDYEYPANLTSVPSNHQLHHLQHPNPLHHHHHHHPPPHQNSLSSLDNKLNNSAAQLNVVLNDISGKKSPGKALNENVETQLTPSKVKKQVYL